MIKISRFFIFLIILFFLGYTNFLGGPFGLAKFLFVVTLVGTIVFSIFLWRIKIFSKKISLKEEDKKEAIKVDVKVIE
jgi:uncharacterized membrane protein